jgi:hypothetical protein
VAEGGFAVGVEGGCQAGGETLGAVVGGQVERGCRDWFLQERVLGFGEVPLVLLESASLLVVRSGVLLVEQGSLGGETAKGGSDRVELDLLDLEVVAVLVDHVVGPEEAQGQVLFCERSVTNDMHDVGGKSYTWT